MSFPGEFQPTNVDEPRLGTAVWVAIASHAGLGRHGPEFTAAIVADAEGRVRAEPLQLDNKGVAEITGTHADGELVGNSLTFRISIPVGVAFPEGMTDRFMLQTIYRCRPRGEPETRLGGLDLFSVFRPYTWGVVHVPE